MACPKRTALRAGASVGLLRLLTPQIRFASARLFDRWRGRPLQQAGAIALRSAQSYYDKLAATTRRNARACCKFWSLPASLSSSRAARINHDRHFALSDPDRFALPPEQRCCVREISGSRDCWPRSRFQLYNDAATALTRSALLSARKNQRWQPPKRGSRNSNPSLCGVNLFCISIEKAM